jgi:hypothetical protein
MSNAIDRSTIEIGPGVVDFNGAIIYSMGGIKLDVDIKTAEQINDLGSREEVLEDVDINVVFTPSDEADGTILPVLYPYGAMALGTEVFGATDVPINIWALSTGKKYTVSAGAVKNQPEFNGSGKGKIYGPCTLRGLCANNTARTTANSTLTIATATFAGRAYDRTKLKAVPYAIALAGASAPWTALLTGAPFKFKPKEKWTDLYIEGHGVVGMVLDDLTAEVEIVKPRNVTSAQMLAQMAIQGTGIQQGASRFTGAANMTLDGGTGNPLITVNKVNVMRKTGFVFHKSDPRFDTLTFAAQRALYGDTLYSIALH